jgi:AraC family transcriptional regulator
MRDEYVSRINRVIDYIENHLDQDLSLEHLAEVAAFSKYHFHRIFRGMTGETLNGFIKRLRVEKAAARLVNNPKETVTEIALDCGFSGPAAFARAFRERFAMSATAWRRRQETAYSKIGETKSKGGKTNRKMREDRPPPMGYPRENLMRRITMKERKPPEVEVRQHPDLRVAYVRHTGPYQENSALFDDLFARLFKWAGPRQLCTPESWVLAVYHDDPAVTKEDKLRVSVCLTVPHGTPAGGEIGTMVVPGGKFAVARFELKGDEYQAAWDSVCGGWLPDSGYQPDDRLCYEHYLNDPKTHPEGKCVVDICVPVKPL